MRIRWHYVGEFYGTLAVPLIYALGLGTISRGNTFTLPPTARLVAIGGIFVGLSLWIISYVHLSRSFGVLPRRQKRVITGIYAHLAHPMYVGIVMTYLSLALANQSRQGLVFTVCILAPLLVVRAYFEDKVLIG